jgi:hypothetical protein
VRARAGTRDTVPKIHSAGGVTVEAGRVVAAVIGESPTPAQSSIIAAAARIAAAAAAERAEDAQHVAAATAASAACAAQAGAAGRQGAAEIQHALRISVADAGGGVPLPIIGGSAVALSRAEAMCDVEFADTAAELGLDAVRRGPDVWADTSDTDALPTMMPATPEQPRSAVTSLHRPNLWTSATGNTTVANRPPASALIPVRAGLYAPQSCGVPAPPVHGSGRGRYCTSCRRLTFLGKGAPVKDRTEAFDRLACEPGAPCRAHEDPAAVRAPSDASAQGGAPSRT